MSPLFQAKSPAVWVLSALLFCGIITGCGHSPQNADGNHDPKPIEHLSHDEQHAQGLAHEHHDDMASHENTVSMNGYTFTLSPEVMDSGETHLDFFVKQGDINYVPNVAGTFHITDPAGETAHIPVQDEGGTHYHGLAQFKEPGVYTIVAQLTINNQAMNPRFEFKRVAK